MWARLVRLAGLLRARLALRGCELGALVFVGGRVRATAEGRIRLGRRTQLFGGMIASELCAKRGAELIVGERCLFNYGVSLAAAQSVRIGDRCSFGALVRVRDSDGRRTAPVRIGDDVWLAHAALIEPGVTVGDGAVIAAGAVVFDDVPAHSLAAGNPARAIPLALVERASAAACNRCAPTAPPAAGLADCTRPR